MPRHAVLCRAVCNDQVRPSLFAQVGRLLGSQQCPSPRCDMRAMLCCAMCCGPCRSGQQAAACPKTKMQTTSTRAPWRTCRPHPTYPRPSVERLQGSSVLWVCVALCRGGPARCITCLYSLYSTCGVRPCQWCASARPCQAGKGVTDGLRPRHIHVACMLRIGAYTPAG